MDADSEAMKRSSDITWVIGLPRSRAEFDALGASVQLEPGILASRALEGDGFAVDVVYLAPGRVFRPHRHLNLHLVIVLDGSGFYYQRDTIVHLSTDSAVEVQNGGIHSLGAGNRRMLAAVVSYPKSPLSEQRGSTILPETARALHPKVHCAECQDCTYVDVMRTALAKLWSKAET